MPEADPKLQVAAVAGAGTSHTTACGGCRIAWRQWGAGPPLVLLHGDAGSWTHWMCNVSVLARRFGVIVPDLPGYGDSAVPDEPVTPASLAALLAKGLAALPDAPRRYHLAGFSFGGIIAGHLAALDAARVEQLILLGAGGLGLPIPPLSAPLRRLGRDMTAADSVAAHRHNLAVLMFGDPARIDRLAIHLQMENVRTARGRAGGFPASDSLRRVLPQVTARLYGIWGERDAFSAPYLAEREALLRGLHPELRFNVIAGAGHWTPYEAADSVNSILLDMLGAGNAGPHPDA